MIKFNSVNCGNDKVFISNLNIEIKENEFMSIESPISLSNLFIDVLTGKEKSKTGSVCINMLEENVHSAIYDFIGVIYDSDYFYDRLRVREYLDIFRMMHGATCDLDNHLKQFGLLDVKNDFIHKLSNDYKRKLSLARECLKKIQLLVIVEPIRNLDFIATKEIIQLLNHIHATGISVISFSSSYKEALMIRPTVYQLSDNGIQLIKDDSKYSMNEDFDTIRIPRISIKVNDKLVLLNPYEIDYIESYDGQCLIYVKNNKFSSNEPLTKIEEKLMNYGFFRSHRSYLVNLQKIVEIISWSKDSYSVVLSDKQKTTVPLAKGRVQELKKVLL